MSRVPAFDARRIDVAAFARAQGELVGRLPLADLRRLLEDAPRQEAEPPAEVCWSARGELRAVPDAPAEIHLHLQAATAVQMTCQRCLEAMTVNLDVRQSLRFVQGEDLAMQIDEESEEDVLALSASLDLHELIEDELILALPLVPRHDHCALQIPTAADATAEAGNPFAALAALRRNGTASD
jgi:uncharacterized protein